MSENFLLIFGSTTFVINALLFLALHNQAKFHGAVQVGLAIIGLWCFIAGVILHVRRKP